MKRWYFLIAAFLLVILVGAIALYIDHEMTRPHRLDLDACFNNMVKVSDALLRYEKRHGVLPRRLEELVPEYVSEQMIYCRECWKQGERLELPQKYRYVYRPEERLLADSAPHRVKGVISRDAEIRRYSIPVQEGLTQKGAPTVVDPPAGALVIEAERFSEVNYGWEVKSDPLAGGGAYLINKEGVANDTAQRGGFGDFYNVGGNQELSKLYYRFRIPEAGTWCFQTRLMTSGTHCSNAVFAFVDGRELGYIGTHREPPFNWTWTRRRRMNLEAGEHELYIHPHEDGVRLDQFLVTREPVEGNAVLRANAAGQVRGAKSLFLIHDLDTCLLDGASLPQVNVWIRKTSRATGWARLVTTLDLPERTAEVLVREFSLQTARSLASIPVDLSGIPTTELPRREYLLQSALTADGKEVCSATTALLRPFQWRVLGMLPFIELEQSLPSDGWCEQEEVSFGNNTYEWQPFANKWYDHFGVMDFGLTFANNSLHAPVGRTVYAQTRFRVAEEGEYLLKVLGDDQMILWIDGEVVATNPYFKPVTRSGQRVKVHLSAGEHTMQYRLNQKEDRWQAAVFVRTADDEIASGVEGLDWLE